MPDSISAIRIVGASRTVLRTVPEPLAVLNIAQSSRAILRTPPSGMGMLNIVPSSRAVLRIASVLDKDLILRPAITQSSTTSPFVIISDDTGVFDGTTNTTGYSPEPSGPANRPARSELDLYIGYYLYQTGQTPQWTFAAIQDPTENPFVLNVFDVPTGVLQFCMIAVPTGTVLTESQKENLYWLAQADPEWFTGEIGYVYDNDLYNDIWELRRNFTDALLCGKCIGKNLKIVEAMEEGLISALSVGQYQDALVIYNSLKTFLNRINGNCGC